MAGCYLRCDLCDATLGGEQVTQKHEAPLGMARMYGHTLRRRAWARGWRTIATRGDFQLWADYCPAHRLLEVTAAPAAPAPGR